MPLPGYQYEVSSRPRIVSSLPWVEEIQNLSLGRQSLGGQRSFLPRGEGDTLVRLACQDGLPMAVVPGIGFEGNGAVRPTSRRPASLGKRIRRRVSRLMMGALLLVMVLIRPMPWKIDPFFTALQYSPNTEEQARMDSALDHIHQRYLPTEADTLDWAELTEMVDWLAHHTESDTEFRHALATLMVGLDKRVDGTNPGLLGTLDNVNRDGDLLRIDSQARHFIQSALGNHEALPLAHLVNEPGVDYLYEFMSMLWRDGWDFDRFNEGDIRLFRIAREVRNAFYGAEGNGGRFLVGEMMRESLLDPAVLNSIAETGQGNGVQE